MRIWVLGARGFLGSWVIRALTTAGHHVVTERVDLLRSGSMLDATQWFQPDVVIHCAKPPSDGIGTMVATPASFAADVLAMDREVILGCMRATPQPRLICMGSVCSYPELDLLEEDRLWEGPPEPINAPYGLAKRMQAVLLDAARKETGLRGTQLILANLYGPGDRTGHVIPATIRKILAAQEGKTDGITVWGTPSATRSFLYVGDAADGIVRMLEYEGYPRPMNLAPSEDTAMRVLVDTLCRLLHYTGPLPKWDHTKPIGAARRRIRIDRLRGWLDGWEPPTDLETGLVRTVEWWTTGGSV